ncbi:SURF1 family cytochrome oxidase biogenesis protein, partial [Nocardia brasiliensis]|uniref:SURF1 family cytochrome oxidase biogenesis protein n=1 Tax=Nocardia brasiliensis TaxID=37326 RepID=UPI0032AEC850
RGGYLQLDDNQPGALTPTPLPHHDPRPNQNKSQAMLAISKNSPPSRRAARLDGVRPPPIAEPPPGPQRLEARVRVSEGVTPGKDPSVQDGFRQVYSIDLAQESAVLHQPLTAVPTGADRGGYLQLDDNQPGAFTPTPLPQLDAGPYLSYGLQWLAFGIMAPLGLGYFVYAELRERRKEKGSAAAASATTPESAPATPVTTESRLADRYGRD